MEAVGLGIAVLGLCADVRARLASIRSAPRMANSMRSRIEHAEGCLSRLAVVLNSLPPTIAMEAAGFESLRRLEESLQGLSATTQKLQDDLHGKSWRRFRSRLPFALDTTKAEEYEKTLDQLVADITVFTSTANLRQLSLLTQELRNLQISSENPTRNFRRQGFALGFHLTNVPSIHHFEGRDAYLERLASTILPEFCLDQRKLEIVSGLGGIGKTQLAIRFAKSHEDKFSSIFFIDAYSHDSISQCFRDIHLLLFGNSSKQLSGVENETTIQQDSSRTREVLEWFCLDGNARWLLIFDNVDRQPSDPEGIDVASFFPPVNRGSIIITTRLNPLEVAGFSKPQIALQPMDNDESRNLLNYYINMLPTSSSTTPAESWEATGQQNALLNRLAGLPLALAQAGSFLETTRMNISQYLDLYDNSRRKLLESHRPLFRNGETLRGGVGTTWRMSIDLLRDMAQKDTRSQYGDALQLLRLITYFEPTDIDFTILRRGLVSNGAPSWFERVFGDELSFVTTANVLVERSLLNSTSKFGIFSMHRVVYDWLCAFEEAEPDEQLLSLAVCAVAFSAPGRLSRSWKDSEKRLFIHSLAMEDRLLRCSFESGGPLADLAALRTHQQLRGLQFIRDPDWYGQLRNIQEPLSLVSYIFSVSGRRETALQIINKALKRSHQLTNDNDVQIHSALLLAKVTILIHQESFEAARNCLDNVSDLVGPRDFVHILLEVDILDAVITRKEDDTLQSVQTLKRCLEECKRRGFGLYHPWTYTATIELNASLDKWISHSNPPLDVASEKLGLLEPYRASAEENAPHDPEARVLLSYLGEAYRLSNAITESLAVLQVGLQAELADGAGDRVNLDDLYYDLTRSYNDALDFVQAAEACGNWVQVREARYGPESMKTAEALSDFCCALESAHPGDPRALQAGLRAAAIIGSDDKREYWRLCQRLRAAYSSAGNQDEAMSWGLKAVESFAPEFGGNREKSAHAEDLQDLGRLYEEAGDVLSAQVYYDRSSACSQEVEDAGT